MRKLIVSEFVTLDGVIQAPGGKDEDRDGGFEYGGWTWPYWHDDIGKSFMALMKDVDAPRGVAEFGYSEDDIPELVDGALKQQRLLAVAPKEVGEEDLRHVITASMTNW